MGDPALLDARDGDQGPFRPWHMARWAYAESRFQHADRRGLGGVVRGEFRRAKLAGAV